MKKKTIEQLETDLLSAVQVLPHKAAVPFHRVPGSPWNNAELLHDLGILQRHRGLRIASHIAPSAESVGRDLLLDMFMGGGHLERRTVTNILILCAVPDCGREQNLPERLLWMEGYRRWEFIRSIMAEYCRRFGWLTNLAQVIRSVDRGFQATSYTRKNGRTIGTISDKSTEKGIMYPAPFGCLDDMPLRDELQDDRKMLPRAWVCPIDKRAAENTYYIVNAYPLGFNPYIEQATIQRMIVDGRPRNGDDTLFQWGKRQNPLLSKRAWRAMLVLLKDDYKEFLQRIQAGKAGKNGKGK